MSLRDIQKKRHLFPTLSRQMKRKTESFYKVKEKKRNFLTSYDFNNYKTQKKRDTPSVFFLYKEGMSLVMQKPDVEIFDKTKEKSRHLAKVL